MNRNYHNDNEFLTIAEKFSFSLTKNNLVSCPSLVELLILHYDAGMVRTQMLIQQRPTRTELLAQATTAGENISVLYVCHLVCRIIGVAAANIFCKK